MLLWCSPDFLQHLEFKEEFHLPLFTKLIGYLTLVIVRDSVPISSLTKRAISVCCKLYLRKQPSSPTPSKKTSERLTSPVADVSAFELGFLLLVDQSRESEQQQRCEHIAPEHSKANHSDDQPSGHPNKL